MYVRWKRRERTRRKRPTGEYVLTAVLVASERINGKPRQRIISYLGTIREDFKTEYWHRFDFWKAADENLNRLELSADDRARIEAVLIAAVQRPTQQDKAQVMAKLEQSERHSPKT